MKWTTTLTRKASLRKYLLMHGNYLVAVMYVRYSGMCLSGQGGEKGAALVNSDQAVGSPKQSLLATPRRRAVVNFALLNFLRSVAKLN